MRYSLSFVFVLLFLVGSIQTHPINNKDSCIAKFDTLSQRTVYLEVDSMPEFPGGSDSLFKFIVNNLKWWNPEADAFGTVIVSVIVETDGSLTNKYLVRGIYSEADNEAMRLISIMPKWKPGKCNGKAVPVKTVVPIKFVLTN